MAKRSTEPDKIVINPLFRIPLDAEDVFAYSTNPEDSEIDGDSNDSELQVDSLDEEYLDESGLDVDEAFDDQDAISLETPENFSIISQKLRRAPGGQQVVDIVIEAEDIDGATNYEIKVAKV